MEKEIKMQNELEIKRVPFMGTELMAARIRMARFGPAYGGCVMEWG